MVSGSFRLPSAFWEGGVIDSDQMDWFTNFEMNPAVPSIDRNARVGPWYFGAIAAAILVSQQANAAAPNEIENFHVYFKLVADTKPFNAAHSADRIIVPTVDPKPLSVAEEPKTESADKAELKTIFNGLVKTWKEGTAGYSITTRRYAHGSYQAILVLGPDVVPLILIELQNRPDWWFEALKALTKADPTKPTDNFHAAVKAWLQWGKEQKPPLIS